MLTVAYCRVSTTEQADDGYSIDGQAEKLRAYAELHDLGEVVVVADPGLSAKNLERPGLQRILAMIEAGHVDNVLVWRLDRLSRDVGDLAWLAKTLGTAGVTLHSFCEKLDMSSATGRMFFNILASFAQFYREQLAENVRMGMAQAMAEGRWVNRPPTGYDMVDGYLQPNADAARVQAVFRLRGQGASQTEISERAGINYSTVRQILHNRAYLGEVKHLDQWLPGIHDPLVTDEQWRAAHRGRTPGRRRGKDLMSGRVTCGTCGRKMSIDSNGQGQRYYRCKHRGEGCDQPSRSNHGLLEAAAKGLSLLCDTGIREAIRQHLEALGRSSRPAAEPSDARAGARLTELRRQRDKLLALHYEDRISSEQFGHEQARITTEIETLEAAITDAATAQLKADDTIAKFEQLLELLDRIDIEALWNRATHDERRTLLDELLGGVTVEPDHLLVDVHGALPLRIAYHEVGLKDSGLSGVGGGTRTPGTPLVATFEVG